MKKFLFGVLLAISTQPAFAAMEDQYQPIIDETIIEDANIDLLEASLRSKKSSDVLACIAGTTLEGTINIIGPAIDITGTSIFSVQTADTDTGLYRANLTSTIPSISRIFSSQLLLGRLGSNIYIGNATTPDDGPQQVAIKKKGKHLELTFTVLLDDSNPEVAPYGQARVVFKLPKDCR